MSDYTHADLLAAVERARQQVLLDSSPWGKVIRDHCDDMAATLDRHESTKESGMPGMLCAWCVDPWGHGDDPWPCPDVVQIITRLTAWGVLGGDGGMSDYTPVTTEPPIGSGVFVDGVLWVRSCSNYAKGCDWYCPSTDKWGFWPNMPRATPAVPFRFGGTP